MLDLLDLLELLPDWLEITSCAIEYANREKASERRLEGFADATLHQVGPESSSDPAPPVR